MAQAGITQCQSDEHLQEKVLRPEVRLGKQTVTFDSRNMNSLGADDQANLFLRPKTVGGGKRYLKIVDFVDRIFQTDNEKLLAEDGTTQMFLNYGPERVSLENVSLPQYMIASITILYTLIETGQIRDFAGTKQYLAYIVSAWNLLPDTSGILFLSMMTILGKYKPVMDCHGPMRVIICIL